jgi:WD40 repeat protein
VHLWDTATGQELLAFQGHTAAVRCVAFSPDGRRLASASDDQTVKIWDAANGRELLTLKGHTAAVWCVTFSPDGWQIASAGWDGIVNIWDARPGDKTKAVAHQPPQTSRPGAGWDQRPIRWQCDAPPDGTEAKRTRIVCMCIGAQGSSSCALHN